MSCQKRFKDSLSSNDRISLTISFACEILLLFQFIRQPPFSLLIMLYQQMELTDIFRGRIDFTSYNADLTYYFASLTGILIHDRHFELISHDEHDTLHRPAIACFKYSIYKKCLLSANVHK